MANKTKEEARQELKSWVTMLDYTIKEQRIETRRDEIKRAIGEAFMHYIDAGTDNLAELCQNVLDAIKELI